VSHSTEACRKVVKHSPSSCGRCECSGMPPPHGCRPSGCRWLSPCKRDRNILE
jgi:hypothetical protein